MTASIRAVYYYEEEASQHLICQEVCRVLADRGHSATAVVLSRGEDVDEPQERLAASRNSSLNLRRLGHSQKASSGQQPFVKAEAAWLRKHKAHVVISAAVPWACAAAAAAGICSVCLAHSTGGKAPHQTCPDKAHLHQPCSSALPSTFTTLISIAYTMKHQASPTCHASVM